MAPATPLPYPPPVYTSTIRVNGSEDGKIEQSIALNEDEIQQALEELKINEEIR